MNKKAFIDIEEINFTALLFAVVAALLSGAIMKYTARSTDIKTLWLVATPIATFIISFIWFSIQFRD